MDTENTETPIFPILHNGTEMFQIQNSVSNPGITKGILCPSHTESCDNPRYVSHAPQGSLDPVVDFFGDVS